MPLWPAVLIALTRCMLSRKHQSLTLLKVWHLLRNKMRGAIDGLYQQCAKNVKPQIQDLLSIHLELSALDDIDSQVASFHPSVHI